MLRATRYLFSLIFTFVLIVTGQTYIARADGLVEVKTKIDRIAKHTSIIGDEDKGFNILPSGLLVMTSIDRFKYLTFLTFYDKNNKQVFKITSKPNESIDYIYYKGIIYVSINPLNNDSYTRLYAYDEKSFKLLWKKELKDLNLEMKDISNNQLVLMLHNPDPDKDSTFYFFNISNGKTLTAQKYNEFEWDLNYTQKENSKGYLVTSKSYKFKYQLQKDEGQVNDIFKDTDGTIYLVTGPDWNERRNFTLVFSFDGKSGQLKWKKEFDFPPTSDRDSYLNNGQLYIKDVFGGLHCIDKNGNLKWTYDFIDSEGHSPMVPTVYFHSSGLIFYDRAIISPKTGKKIANFAFHYNDIVSNLYWMDDDDNIYSQGLVGKRLPDGTLSPDAKKDPATYYFKHKITNVDELLAASNDF